MPRWTNDLYRSNMHRVKNVQIGRWRYSIPFFYNPRPTARIVCLPGCADADNPPRYEPCTSGEHIAEMARRAVNYS
jgi:isopenicillin N synthase-like dioxygenase